MQAAQIGFGLPSIGGKDSMSGTFNDIDVPPTLVSFAVDVAKVKDVITPELKKAGSKLVWLRAPKDSYDLPDYPALMEQYDKLHQDIQAGRVISAYALDRHGIAAAVSKMAFGNGRQCYNKGACQEAEKFPDTLLFTCTTNYSDALIYWIAVRRDAGDRCTDRRSLQRCFS